MFRVNKLHKLFSIAILFTAGASQMRADQNAGSPTPQVSTTTLSFGDVPFPSTQSQSLMVKNVGGGRLVITPVINGPSYTILSSTCAAGVGAGDSCTLQIQYAPVQVGLHDDHMTLNNNGATTPVVHLLGLASGISAIGQDLKYGSFGRYLDFSFIPVESSESLPLEIENDFYFQTVKLKFLINGPSYTIPEATYGCLAGISIGQTCKVIVLYKPVGTGIHNDRLTIIPNIGLESQIGLIGAAI